MKHLLMQNNITDSDINVLISFLKRKPRLTSGQKVLEFDYTKYLDQFFRKLKEHSHTNIPSMVNNVKDNTVNEKDLPDNVKSNLQDSDSEENINDHFNDNTDITETN